jgi:hypothetical protein
VKAVRAIIAAVADLLRVGPVPIARGRVIVNLDTTPVQLHTTTFQTGDPTGARNFSYLDRIHLIRLFTVGRATLSFSLVLVWFDGVARIAGSSRVARTARSGGRAEICVPRAIYCRNVPTTKVAHALRYLYDHRPAMSLRAIGATTEVDLHHDNVRKIRDAATAVFATAPGGQRT